MTLEPRFKNAFLLLSERFGTESFTSQGAEQILGDKFANVREVLSELLKSGFLKVQQDPSDKRKRIYKLKRLTLYNEISRGRRNSISKDELLRLLKQGADIIRTRVDYKVLLLFLFYKSISDKYVTAVKKWMEQDRTEDRARELANTEVLEMYDPEERNLYTWHQNVNEPERFIKALFKIEDLNPDYLKGMRELIARTGLQSLSNSEENRRILMQLIDLFGRIDFSTVNYDILGDAYEWILSYFAPGKAKEGEVYTPLEVSRLMAQIAEPNQPGEVIVDPACGSGSMLIEFYRVAREWGIEPMLYGQEANEVSAILARLNFILHGIQNVQIYTGDSLLNPHFPAGTITIANPPWNQDGYDQNTLEGSKVKSAYRFGFPTKKSGDWAWLQLLTHFSRKLSTLVIDTGALFRGGREKQIRRAFLERDLIEAVILLPEKIFYNTTAPAAIIVINKQKPEERKGKVLFINASNEYQKHHEVKKLNQLTQQHIQKIADTYHQFKEEEGFSRVVAIDEIRENDYNLNVPLYVAPPHEEEEIDLAEELKAMEELDREYSSLISGVSKFIAEILESYGSNKSPGT